VAKGLWRGEILYVKVMLDRVIRVELDKILALYLGSTTGFSVNLGKRGKHVEEHLEPELWAMLERTYWDTGIENTWEALMVMSDLFRRNSVSRRRTAMRKRSSPT